MNIKSAIIKNTYLTILSELLIGACLFLFDYHAVGVKGVELPLFLVVNCSRRIASLEWREMLLTVAYE